MKRKLFIAALITLAVIGIVSLRDAIAGQIGAKPSTVSTEQINRYDSEGPLALPLTYREEELLPVIDKVASPGKILGESENMVESVQAEQSAIQPLPDDSLHQYYWDIPPDIAEAAEKTASGIAAYVMGRDDLSGDLERVRLAAEIVAKFYDDGVYGRDDTKFYRSPAGVYVLGTSTCAGTTRALGRVLDHMGSPWTHVNENQFCHQWCVLEMDGKTGYADGMAGIAGYGQMYSGMQLEDGTILEFVC